jgi:hypothetical protein
MARINETGAHLELCATAREVQPARIGAHFHKPAPVRATRRADRGASAGFLVSFLVPALCLAAFFVQL